MNIELQLENRHLEEQRSPVHSGKRDEVRLRKNREGEREIGKKRQRKKRDREKDYKIREEKIQGLCLHWL